VVLLGYIFVVEVHSTRACVANQQAMLLTSIPEVLIYTEGYQNELSTIKRWRITAWTAKART